LLQKNERCRDATKTYIEVLRLWQSGVKSPKTIARKLNLKENHVRVILYRLRKRGAITVQPDLQYFEIHFKKVIRDLDDYLLKARLGQYEKKPIVMLRETVEELRDLLDLYMKVKKHYELVGALEIKNKN